MLSGSLTSLPATQQGDASCNGVMPLLTAGFFGYLPSIFSGLYAQVFYGKRIEHSKQFTAYRNYRLDFLQWCNNGEEAEILGFLQVFASRGITARNRIALSLDLPRRLISVGPLCLPELFSVMERPASFWIWRGDSNV